MLGGEVNYTDISEGLQTRAEGIRAVRSSIANRRFVNNRINTIH